MKYFGWPLDAPPDHGDAADKARLFESWMHQCMGEGLFEGRKPLTPLQAIKSAPDHLRVLVNHA